MATANNNLQISELDFSSIKLSLTNFLSNNPTFKDYNFTGSALSTLLDVLAYNTQYNAFYLNQVANEMFLDTALQRSSVVSKAKLLNYMPKSAVAPVATVNVLMTGLNNVTQATLPSYSKFTSQALKNVNYPFITIKNYSAVPDANGNALFTNVQIVQGTQVTQSFIYNMNSNPSALFQLPDSNIDTSTIQVTVYSTPSSTAFDTYTLASDYLELSSSSFVYFLQEALNGNYELYFGDGNLGVALNDGCKVVVSYITTKGSLGNGANNFTSVSNLYNRPVVVYPTYQGGATGGTDRESIDKIKFSAPKAYSAQKRAVTKNDYITAVQQNKIGLSFDAVNVWGGEENDPPVYGQVFVSMKPAGSYNLTTTQKQRIISEVLKPVSVMTVSPSIVDPDYTYIKITSNVYYDPSKTNLSPTQLQSGIINAIQQFGANTLNTFNSTFNQYDLLSIVQNYDPSIITNEAQVQVQKKFLPNLNTSTSYQLYFGVPLARGSLLSGISSNPSMQFINVNDTANNIQGVFLQEVPVSTSSVDSITVLNPGFGYQSTPTVTIYGDGTGATAHAVLVQGAITKIVVDTPGSGYTAALAVITPQTGDTTGTNGYAVVNLLGEYGTIESYYNKFDTTINSTVKTVLKNNVGQIDYKNGLITLNQFNPVSIDNLLGQLTITANPTTTIFSSSYNRIITLDPFDPSAITVNIIPKNNS